MKMIMVSMVTGSDEVGNDTTTPTVLNAEFVRCFYPRKEDRSGTRVTFDDGGGWAISESYADLSAKMAQAGILMTEFTMTTDAPAEIDEEGEVVNAHDERLSVMAVQTEFIRCFYPRKDNKVGTRLTFGKGSGMAVHELFEQVTALCGAAPVVLLARPVADDMVTSR
jgi:hypothetical protein